MYALERFLKEAREAGSGVGRGAVERGCVCVHVAKGKVVRSGIRTHASRGDWNLNAVP